MYYTGCTWSPLICCTTLAALEAHSSAVLHWLHLEPTHLLYYTGCTWSPLTSTAPAALGAYSPVLLTIHLEPTHQYYTGCTWSLLTSTTPAALGAHSPVLHRLHLEPTHLLYCTGCTVSLYSPCSRAIKSATRPGSWGPSVEIGETVVSICME
jgi:hypothetical protein